MIPSAAAELARMARPTPERARLPVDLIGFSRLPPTRVVREYSWDAGRVRASDPAPVQY